MSGTSSELFEATDREMIRISENLNSRYESLRSNPDYWASESRATRMSRAIEKDSSQIPGLSRNFYENTMPDAYLLGGQSVNETFDYDDEDLKLISQMQDRGLNDIQISQELSRRNLANWLEEASGDDDPNKLFTKRAAPTPLKGMITKDGRSWRPESYARLVMAADASTAYNLGVLSAAEKEGLSYVRVVDGTGCGWSDHRDPDAAHGKIVKLKEARSHPIAHPYCQRTFVVDDDTRKRKRSGRSRKAIRAATVLGGATSGGGAVGFASLKYSPSLQARLTAFLELTNPDFKEWRRRMLQDGLSEDNVIRIGDDWLDDPGGGAVSDIPNWLVTEADLSDRKVVGDAFSDFTESAMRFRAGSPEGFRTLNAETAFTQHANDVVSARVLGGGNIKYNFPDILTGRKLFGFESISDVADAYLNISDRVTGTLSRAIGENIRFGALLNRAGDVSRYGSVRFGQFAKYRVSHIQRGFANRLILNPSGMLRAGFVLDPKSGLVTPSLRFLPDGPIRVNTTLSRSRGRYFVGKPVEEDLRRILKPRAWEATRVLDEVQLDAYKRAVESGTVFEEGGWKITKPLLNVDDFLPDTIEDIIFDTADGVIRRGRIPNALVYRDGKGRAVVKDLLIKDGAFVTRVDIEKGLVTSARTEISILLPKSARLTLRTATDLTDFEITSLSDLKHVRLSELLDFSKDIKERVRITGLTAEFMAFGYSPWEMRKVFSYSWEDGVLFHTAVRDEALKRVTNIALQNEFLVRLLADLKGPLARSVYEELPSEIRDFSRRVASDLGRVGDEALFAFGLMADSRRHILKAIVSEVDAKVMADLREAIAAIDGQYAFAKRELREFIAKANELSSAMVSEMNKDDILRRIAQVRTAVRDDVAAFLELDRADVIKMSDYTDPGGAMKAAVPNIPRAEVVAHELGRIVSLTHGEIREILGTTLARAKEIWDHAFDSLSTIISQRYPFMARYLETFTPEDFRNRNGATTESLKRNLGDRTSGADRDYNQFYESVDVVGDIAGDAIEDLRVIIPWIEQRFPAMKGRTTFEVGDPAGEMFDGTMAYVLPRFTGMYFNPQYATDNWDQANKVIRTSRRSKWFADGARDMKYIIVHEYGHVIHLQTEAMENEINRRFLTKLLDMKDGKGDPLFLQTFRIGGQELAFRDAVRILEASNGEFVNLGGDKLTWAKLTTDFMNAGNIVTQSLDLDVSMRQILFSSLTAKTNLKTIKKSISQYGTFNWYEFVAETFATGMMGGTQGPIPTALLEAFDEALEIHL